jgi:hypothetical protein
LLRLSPYFSPASSQIFIKGIDATLNYHYSVVDNTGRIVNKVLNSKGNEINIQELEPGFYILMIETEENTWSSKFIKK